MRCDITYTAIMTITGKGTRSTSVVAMERNVSEKPEMGRPCVNRSAAPRAMLIMPSVAMNGGRRPIEIKTPLPIPHASPTSNPIVNASGIDRPAARLLAITAPENANTEPTDRSIPAVIITNVIPAATTAIIEVCSAILSRFETVRKYGERIQSTKHRLSKPDKVPICRFRLILNSAPILLAERAAKDLLLSCLTSVKFPTDFPLMHHEDAIAHTQNFGHLRRNHDNRNAICSEPVHEVIDLFLCSHVDSTRRLVKNEDLRLTAQPFAQHDLLLISSAEIYHLLAESRGFDMEVADEFSGKPLLLGAAHNPKLRNLTDAGKTHIRHHGQSQNQALRLSILRQETDSRRDG